MIGRSGERGSGISVLAARHNNDDDVVYCIVRVTIKLTSELYKKFKIDNNSFTADNNNKIYVQNKHLFKKESKCLLKNKIE